MRPLIIANWKMNLGYRDSLKLAEDLVKAIPEEELYKKDVVVCPSILSLLIVAEIFKKHHLVMGAQDAFWEEQGAFTGCESPKFLWEAGCRLAIIGHSERRQNLQETDEMANKKIKAALSAKLAPVLCVGETYEERAATRTDSVIMNQVIKALAGIELLASEQLVIAYEPVWVIGSGRPIEPKEAEHAFRIIYQTLLDLFPLTIIQNNIRIIYGGSIDGATAGDFTDLEYFGGFLVGSASLHAEEFASIIKQTN
jgi:triosephosphate isomerase (TIM)